MKIAALALCAAALQAAPVAFINAKIYPVSGPAISRGTVVIDNGKIVAVGSNIAVPSGAKRVDCAGRIILPGIVDTHSHIGLSQIGNSDGNERSGPTQPALRAIDAILPTADNIRVAQSGGLTTVNIMPGSGNIMGGQTAYVKLRGKTIEEMLLVKDGISGGMKMANGDNPKGYGRRGQAPSTRMAVAALQRRIFIRAQNYRQKWDDYRSGKEKTEPARDLELEPVVEILDGKRTVHFHTHRADDIMTVLRLRDEFGFNVVLQHVSEGYKVADEIARRNVPASIIVIDSPGGKLEAAEFDPRNAAILEKAGVKIAFHSDDNIVNSRFLIRSAALAIRYGLSEEAALLALTLNPAEMLDAGNRIGSIEPGKDADLVVLSGEPFSTYTKVLETWIDGEKVFDRSQRMDRLYQTGGAGVADRYPDLGGGR